MEEGPKGQWTFEGEQFHLQGNLWLATKGKFQLLQRENDRLTVRITKEFSFQNIEINTVTDAAFDFPWPTGSALFDEDTRTKLYRDASGKWVKRMDVAQEVSHAPNSVSAADFAPWAFLVSLAGLLTLGVLRWRRASA